MSLAFTPSVDAVRDTARRVINDRALLRSVLMIGVPALVLLVVAYFYFMGGRYVSTDNAYVKADMVAVSPDVGGRIVAV
jgi:membrane fusion protein (multidrug efflux system)